MNNIAAEMQYPWNHPPTPEGLHSAPEPKFPISSQLEPLSPVAEEAARFGRDSQNWLAETEASIQRDLDSSKKELELIKEIVGDIERRTAAATASQRQPNSQLRDQKVLMAACQEYSRSRIHLLKQRLRQVIFWSNNRRAGKRTPERPPVEWDTADREWRQWLGEQGAARTRGGDRAQQQQQGGGPGDGGSSMGNDAPWGPLLYILEAYTVPWDERGV